MNSQREKTILITKLIAKKNPSYEWMLVLVNLEMDTEEIKNNRNMYLQKNAMQDRMEI